MIVKIQSVSTEAPFQLTQVCMSMTNKTCHLLTKNGLAELKTDDTFVIGIRNPKIAIEDRGISIAGFIINGMGASFMPILFKLVSP